MCPSLVIVYSHEILYIWLCIPLISDVRDAGHPETLHTYYIFILCCIREHMSSPAVFWRGPCCSSSEFVFLLRVFTFWVPCCAVRDNFRINTIFSFSLPLIVCRRTRVLFTLFRFFLRMVMTNTYCIVFYTHTVTCCDMHGTTQWEFRDERVLQYPYGITVDNDGNVYVAGYNSNNVVVISPDGERHRQLLSDKDGLEDPTVLDYDVSTNRLLVVNQEGTAFLFDVTRKVKHRHHLIKRLVS